MSRTAPMPVPTAFRVTGCMSGNSRISTVAWAMHSDPASTRRGHRPRRPRDHSGGHRRRGRHRPHPRALHHPAPRSASPATAHSARCPATPPADRLGPALAARVRTLEPVRPAVTESVESGTGARGRAARARRIAARTAERLETTVIGRWWSRLLEVEFVDRSVALAAKAFVSLFPLMIVISALTPDRVRQEILQTLADRLGVDGQSRQAVRQAFASPDAIKAATGLIGVLLTVAFAVSFTTALQRLYLRAWRRPPGGGLRNKGRGVIWVAGG